MLNRELNKLYKVLATVITMAKGKKGNINSCQVNGGTKITPNAENQEKQNHSKFRINTN